MMHSIQAGTNPPLILTYHVTNGMTWLDAFLGAGVAGLNQKRVNV